MGKLGILDCDELAPALKADYKNYATMFQNLLYIRDRNWTTASYSLLANECPDSVGDCDAYLITGSKSGVYDDDAWIKRLRGFIKEAFERKIPLIGFCFGHQILADTLGGRAVKSDKGWGIGARRVYLEPSSKRDQSIIPEWLRPEKSELVLLYSHQDQVESLPEGARRLYGDAFCPNAGYVIPGRVMALQGHPEFTKDYISRLMAARKDRYAPGQYEQACASLEESLDNQLVADWVFAFLESSGKD